MTETTERFFQEISTRVGYHNVSELHLFPPIKQGTQVSGIAVVAATPGITTRDGLERHIVYTARYRHTLKGPDRGKWEFDLKAEADAPLISIDEVVRGVGERSGDASQSERLSGDEFRAIVPAPEAPESEPALPEPPDSQPADSDDA